MYRTTTGSDTTTNHLGPAPRLYTPPCPRAVAGNARHVTGCQATQVSKQCTMEERTAA